MVYGVGFILQIGSLSCIGLAGLLWLMGPFRDRRAQKAAKIILWAAAVVIAVGLISFIWIEGEIISGQDGSPADDADVLVVLGAGLKGKEPSLVLQSRLEAAYDYLNSHPGCVAVLTGSQGPTEEATEASVMASWLENKGISADRLYLEEEAHNTAQNIKYSVALMEQEGLDGRVMVVSSEFHLYRAEKIFERFGIDAASLPAETPKIGLVPLNSYVREYCSVVVMHLKDALGVDE